MSDLSDLSGPVCDLSQDRYRDLSARLIGAERSTGLEPKRALCIPDKESAR
jgi:hypothetical protein